MTQGFETLRLGQESLQLGQDSLLRRVSDMQQRQYHLVQHLHNLEVDLQHQPREPFPEYLLQPYRSPSPDRPDVEWESWPE